MEPLSGSGQLITPAPFLPQESDERDKLVGLFTEVVSEEDKLKGFITFFSEKFPVGYEVQKQQLNDATGPRLKRTIAKILQGLTNRDLLNLEKESYKEYRTLWIRGVLELAGTFKKIDQVNEWTDEYQKNLRLHALVRELLFSGNVDVALEVLCQIGEEYQKTVTLIEFLTILVKSGSAYTAVRIVMTLSGDWLKSGSLKALTKGITKDQQMQLRAIIQMLAALGHLERAIDVLNLIAVNDIALGKEDRSMIQDLLTLGHLEKALEVLTDKDQKILEVRAVALTDEQCLTVRLIIQEIVAKGDLERGLDILYLITDKDQKKISFQSLALQLRRSLKLGFLDSDLLHVVKEVVKRGNLDRALSLTLSAEEKDRDSPLSHLVTILVKEGNFKKALEIIDSISSGKVHANCQLMIALALLGKGEMDQAIEVGDKITLESVKDEFLDELSKHYASLDEMDKSVTVANIICAEALRAKAIMRLVLIYAGREDIEIALSTLKLIPSSKLISNGINQLEGKKNTACLNFVKALIKNKKMNEALFIVNVLAKDYQAEGIQFLFDAWLAIEAMEMGYRMLDRSLRSAAFVKIANFYLDRGELDKVLSYPKEFKESVMISIIKYVAKTGDFDRALELVKDISRPLPQSAALFQIVLELKKQGHLPRAKTVADTIPEKFVRDQALKELVDQ